MNRSGDPGVSGGGGNAAARSRGLVSVITIFLDADEFLAEAVRSVLAQTSRSWELLLVDDGSTDGSTGTAKAFAARYPERIRYLDHADHANLGMSASRNAGIRASRGHYIAFLDSDDTWLPQKLERQVALLEEHPEAALVFGPTLWWHSWTGSAEDARRDFVTTPPAAPQRVHPGRRILKRILSHRADPIYTCSVLIRREAVLAVGGFEPRFRGLFEDQAFFAKLLLEHDVYVTDECHDRYRQHPDSCCGIATNGTTFLSPDMLAARADYLRWLASYLENRNEHDGLRPTALRELRLTRSPTFLHARHRMRSALDTVLGRSVTLAFAAARRILPTAVRHRMWTLATSRRGGTLARNGDVERLRPLLRHWDIRRFRIEQKLGETSAVSWRLKVRGEDLVLREARCSQRYLDFQVSVMQHLRASDFPYEVPQIVATRDAASYIVDRSGVWLIYRFIEGDDAAEPSGAEDASAIAELVAHYHRSVASHEPDRFRDEFRLELFDFAGTTAVLEDLLPAGNARAGAGPLAGLLARELDSLNAACGSITASEIEATGRLPLTSVYNDWHQHNRVVRSGRIVGMVDFDSVTEAPRIVDFQNALSYVLMAVDEPDLELVEAFSAAYNDVLPLAGDELSLVRAVMIDRLFWIIGDVADEIRRLGSSEREGLAVRFAGLLLWLGRNGGAFAAALQRGVAAVNSTRA